MIPNFNTYLTETLWGNSMKRASSEEARKEDGHIFKKWGIPIKIKCDDNTCEYILHHLLFWRDDYDLDEGPEAHWIISQNFTSGDTHPHFEINLHNEYAYKKSYFVLDTFKSFMNLEQDWYGDDCDDTSYNLDEDDYNELVNLAIKKIQNLTFIKPNSFSQNQISNLTCTSDVFGVILCKFNRVDELNKERILNEIKSYLETIGVNKWNIEHCVLIENCGPESFVIMKFCEDLINNYDDIKKKSEDIVSKYHK